MGNFIAALATGSKRATERDHLLEVNLDFMRRMNDPKGEVNDPNERVVKDLPTITTQPDI